MSGWFLWMCLVARCCGKEKREAVAVAIESPLGADRLSWLQALAAKPEKAPVVRWLRTDGITLLWRFFRI